MMSDNGSSLIGQLNEKEEREAEVEKEEDDGEEGGELVGAAPSAGAHGSGAPARCQHQRPDRRVDR